MVNFVYHIKLLLLPTLLIGTVKYTISSNLNVYYLYILFYSMNFLLLIYIIQIHFEMN